jgi:hypothetical protein
MATAQNATQTAPALGAICWSEIMTPDPQKTKAFYTKLFGWTAETMPMGKGEYTFLKNAGTGLGGIQAFEKGQQNPQPMWVNYFAVESVDQSTRMAESLGAKTRVPPTDIPGNKGRFAILTDPTGATFAVYQCT